MAAKKKETVQSMETIIVDMFKNAVDGFLMEGLSDIDYQLCEDTIHTTLTYFKNKRQKGWIHNGSLDKPESLPPA